MEAKEIGSRIRYRRRLLDLTQEELAAEIGTSRSNLARYEAGDVDLNVSTIERLSAALRCKKSYLIGDDDDAFAGGDRPKLIAFYDELGGEEQDELLAYAQYKWERARRQENVIGKKAADHG